MVKKSDYCTYGGHVHCDDCHLYSYCGFIREKRTKAAWSTVENVSNRRISLTGRDLAEEAGIVFGETKAGEEIYAYRYGKVVSAGIFRRTPVPRTGKRKASRHHHGRRPSCRLDALTGWEPIGDEPRLRAKRALAAWAAADRYNEKEPSDVRYGKPSNWKRKKCKAQWGKHLKDGGLTRKKREKAVTFCDDDHCFDLEQYLCETMEETVLEELSFHYREVYGYEV